ncbi:MAG: RNA polymerase sigma factor [Armatimonadetes bacterium]|nr:RNA polymerase sigma factor [Armatimonadota bacterium]
MAVRTKHYEYIDQLVQRAQAGDDDALVAIMEFYRPLLRTAVKYCVSNYPTAAPYAEDLEADLFLIVRELVHRYDKELSYFSYFLSTRIDYALQTHARKHYLDATSGGRRPKEVFIEDLPADWEPFVDYDPVGKILDGAILSQALSRLKDTHREAIRLYYFENMSQEQAAAFLEITQPSFSKRLNRALGELRKLTTDSSEIFV